MAAPRAAAHDLYQVRPLYGAGRPAPPAIPVIASRDAGDRAMANSLDCRGG